MVIISFTGGKKEALFLPLMDTIVHYQKSLVTYTVLVIRITWSCFDLWIWIVPLIFLESIKLFLKSQEKVFHSFICWNWRRKAVGIFVLSVKSLQHLPFIRGQGREEIAPFINRKYKIGCFHLTFITSLISRFKRDMRKARKHSFYSPLHSLHQQLRQRNMEDLHSALS